MAVAPLLAPSTADIDLRNRLDRRLSELKLERTGQELEWREIAEYILPHRGRWLPTPTGRQPRRGRKIIDPEATKCAGRLSAFCQSGITTPSAKWFRLGVSNDNLADDDEVKAWLGECERRLTRVLTAGNFYPSLEQVYEELTGFGTGVCLILPDYQDVARYYPLTAGEFYLGLDARQEVETLYREYSLTTVQMVGQFGEDVVSPQVRDAWDRKTNLANQWIVVHAIEPNRDHVPGRVGPKGKPWLSTYYERGWNGGFLRKEGFDYKPFVAPRWHALAGEPYGTGPGHRALADTKSLQSLVRRYHELIAKLAEPPLQGDAKNQNAFLDLMPGGLNWITGADLNPHAGLRPIYQVSPQVRDLGDQIKVIQTSLGETFYNDLVLMLEQKEGVQPMNELEITERRQEKLLQLGPMLERFHSEALAPLVRTTLRIMAKARILPPPPPQMQGKQVDPQFVSSLAQAQKAVGTTGLEQLVRIVGSMAGLFPEAGLKLDASEFIDEYADSLSLSGKVLVPTKTVKALMAQKEQQAQQAQQATNAQKLAGAAANVGNIDVGGGQTAAARMIGGSP